LSENSLSRNGASVIIMMMTSAIITIVIIITITMGDDRRYQPEMNRHAGVCGRHG
jgi:hypothetical protein